MGQTKNIIMRIQPLCVNVVHSEGRTLTESPVQRIEEEDHPFPRIVRQRHALDVPINRSIGLKIRGSGANTSHVYNVTSSTGIRE